MAIGHGIHPDSIPLQLHAIGARVAAVRSLRGAPCDFRVTWSELPLFTPCFGGGWEPPATGDDVWTALTRKNQRNRSDNAFVEHLHVLLLKEEAVVCEAAGTERAGSAAVLLLLAPAGLDPSCIQALSSDELAAFKVALLEARIALVEDLSAARGI